MKNRIAKIKRITKETQIEAEMNLDGDGNADEFFGKFSFYFD